MLYRVNQDFWSRLNPDSQLFCSSPDVFLLGYRMHKMPEPGVAAGYFATTSDLLLAVAGNK
ncbi:MAG TPA: hypothetical protein VFV68_09770 [Agriterribacter sp.]|nr:hypothetical protein [Agriterribacter sp.]